MNDWVVPRLTWDDSYQPDRGRVLSLEEIQQLSHFERYNNEDENSVAARTLPGVDPKAAYFTRGSGHAKTGAYTEIPSEYREVVDRLARKHKAAAQFVPAPVITQSPAPSPQSPVAIGLITLGGCDQAVREAALLLPEYGVFADVMRLRGFPFDPSVEAFIAEHDVSFVIEQNRDGQLRSLLILETGAPKEKLRSLLVYGGFPLSTRHVIEGITSQLGENILAVHH
jgi:2-oxoglutarate/2-oxoacid ferredoxin oxidoreductase subunit alpha